MSTPLGKHCKEEEESHQPVLSTLQKSPTPSALTPSTEFPGTFSTALSRLPSFPLDNNRGIIPIPVSFSDWNLKQTPNLVVDI